MYMILLILVGILAVHLFKMMRLYFVLMEHKMPFLKFVLLYVRTTFLNLLIPFKLGELFRIEEIARETRIWQVGILSVLIDRFFDTAALSLILLPIDLFVRRELSVITAVFLLVIILVSFFYLVFPASYQYLNHYLIIKKASPRTMAALRGLDIAKSWYDFAKNLIQGRFALILTASALGWAAEIATLKAISIYAKLSFGIMDFVSYIEAIFMQKGSELLKGYTWISCIILFACALLGYSISLICLISKRRRNAKQ